MSAIAILDQSRAAVPTVRINIGGTLANGIVTGGFDVPEVLDYSYTTDILTLTDSCAVDVANPDGKYTSLAATNRITKGARLYLAMQDPLVAGGANVVRLAGLVVNPRLTSMRGEKVQIQGADQGWYLERCDAPLWLNLQASKTFLDFLDKCLKGHEGQDFKWGFYDSTGTLKLAVNNTVYQQLLRHLNQGAAGAQRQATAQALKGGSVTPDGAAYVAGATLPPLQTGTGAKIGQLFIDFARRGRLLVNVTSDGALMFFKPDYTQAPSYRIEYHADPETNVRNGVLDVSIDDSVDGIPTDVHCVATNPWFVGGSAPTDVNADKIHARYQDATAAPHYMRMTFADDDQIGKLLVNNRAKWALQRGEFDAFKMDVTVFGHSQGGNFYAPDTMVSVNDTVHGVVGNYYCSACRYSRDKSSGTRTVLTLRKAGLLAA